jgi:RNA polymerase sigma-70 factor (ECF subfamily)
MLNWIAARSVAVPRAPAAVGHEPNLAERVHVRPAAFAQLYARYVDPVYRYCYRRLGSREAAEDATSEIFCNALEALPRFTGDSFRSWLFAIAHNVVADQFRRQAWQHPANETVEGTDPDPTPEESAMAAEACGALRSLLGSLRPDQRDVIELRLAGLTGAEIAATLGRTLGAVKMLQLRAIQRLRVLSRAALAPKESADGQA